MSTSSSKDTIHNTVAREPQPARKDRPSADAPDWAAAERSAALPCELHLSSRELDKIPPGRRQGRIASGRTLRVGFIVTNMARAAENVVAFYNKRGTCEQWIKEGKGAIKWTRLSCRTFAANAVRLQLHALAFSAISCARGRRRSRSRIGR